MGDELYKNILRVVHQQNLPKKKTLTPAGKALYQQGMDAVASYRGQPDVLVQAIHDFIQTDSLPYACAGIASVIAAASYQRGTEYSQPGLQEALRWMERAQELSPDDAALVITEANIYVNMQHLDEAAVLIDRLRPQLRNDFNFLSTEMYYWRQRKDSLRVAAAFKRGIALANNTAQKLFMQESMATHYMEMREYPRAIENYNAIIKLDPKNAWAWHNVSLMLFGLKQYREAARYNRQALKLMNFGAAQHARKMIEPKLTAWDKFMLNFI